MAKKDFSEAITNRPSKTEQLFDKINENMGKQKEIVTEENTEFITGRNTENFTEKVTELKLERKRLKSQAETKQTIKIDKKKYEKLKKYCIKNGVSFQRLMADLIDIFLESK